MLQEEGEGEIGDVLNCMNSLEEKCLWLRFKFKILLGNGEWWS